MRVTIYTDGSCNSRTRIGGFGVYLIAEDGTEQHFRKGFTNTTTSRMEMRALLYALRMIDPDVPMEVTVKADSQFVVKSFTEGWLEKWKMCGFVGTKNPILWKEIVREFDSRPQMQFKIEWVRGHQKDLSDPDVFGNNCADALADFNTQDSYEEDTVEI